MPSGSSPIRSPPDAGLAVSETASLLSSPSPPRHGPRPRVRAGAARGSKRRFGRGPQRVGERNVLRMKPTEIVRVHGRGVWASRARPTVEAEVALAGGAYGRAMAPAGASRGSG